MDAEDIMFALSEQKSELKERLKKDFVFRGEENLVDVEGSLAQVVIGVRRSGKSTLCHNILKSSKINFAYVNFDDERLSEIHSQDLNTILEVLYKIYGDFNHLFIDEIQNVSEWYLFVNRLLRTGMHILITGSNAKLLSGELATHLTGRYIQTEMFPFSFSEFCDYKKVQKNYDTTKTRAFLSAAFDEYLQQGGFPELLKEKRKQAYINSLVKNILQNDIEKRYAIKYKSAFEQLADHLLNNAPVKLNYKDLQKTFGFKSDHTAENYVQFLKNAYLLVSLHKYSQKSKIRVRDEKVYPVDVALMNNRKDAFVGENLGWRLESIVYIELLRRHLPLEHDIYYFEETSGECDFVVCQGKNIIELVQVSYDISNPKTLRREISGLLLAHKKTECNNLLLITKNERKTIEKDNLKIKVVPAFEWMVEIQNL